MGFLDWFKKGSKGLLDLSETELRKEERFVQKDKDKIARRLERLAAEREQLFQRGAKAKDPNVRKAVALEYELKAQEMKGASREMLLASKAVLTLSRLRQVRQSSRAGAASVLSRITETDQVKLRRLIADAEVNEELYSEKLDNILGLTEREGELELALSDEGQRVLDLWNRIDDGEIHSVEDAMKIAEIDRLPEGPEPEKA